jgi:hypothetical protein
LTKWAGVSSDPELIALFTIVTGETEALKNAHNVFVDVFQNVYLKAIDDIHKAHSSLTKHHEKVKALEQKVRTIGSIFTGDEFTESSCFLGCERQRRRRRAKRCQSGIANRDRESTARTQTINYASSIVRFCNRSITKRW